MADLVMDQAKTLAAGSSFAAQLAAVKTQTEHKINSYVVGVVGNSAYLQAEITHLSKGSISTRIYEKDFGNVLNFDETGEPVSIKSDKITSTFKSDQGNWITATKKAGSY